MQIFYSSNKLKKEFENGRKLQQGRGQEVGSKIQTRLAQLDAATCLEDVRYLPGKYHPLKEDKLGWLACSLTANERLIFEPVFPEGSTPPVPDDWDWTTIKAVKILGVLDYHEKKNSKPK